MISFFWRLVAKLLARPAIADWLIARAKLTPYQHIMSADGAEMYMGRVRLNGSSACTDESEALAAVRTAKSIQCYLDRQHE
jgi:hypothetical protein